MTTPAAPAPSKKPSLKTPVGALGLGMLLGLLLTFISPKEGGRRLDVYLDSAGIATTCRGIIGPEVTKRWKEHGKDARFTAAECDQLETRYLERMHATMSKCLGPDILEKLSLGEFLGYGDGDYNFGDTAFCKSPMVVKLKAGDRKGACNAIASFRVYTRTAGNRRPRGKGQLVDRIVQGKVVPTWYQDCRDPANKCTGLPKRREEERQVCLAGLPEAA